MGALISHSPFHRMFTRLDAEAVEPKDQLDRVAEFAGATTGPWRALQLADHTLQAATFAPLSTESRRRVEVGRGIIGTAGGALLLPTLFDDAVSLRNRVRGFALNPSSREAVRLTSQVSLAAYDTADAALFVSESGLAPRLSTRAAGAVNGVYLATSVVCDAIEICEEGCEINKHQMEIEAAKTDQFRSLLRKRQALSWLKIATAVHSIAFVFLSIAALATAPSGGLIIALFVLSSVWLAGKISAYFYEQKINS